MMIEPPPSRLRAFELPVSKPARDVQLQHRQRRYRNIALNALLTVVLIAVLLLSAVSGPLLVSPAEAFQIVTGHLIPGMPWMSDGTLSVLQDQAVWQFRLPRSLLAAIAGAALALAGSLIQAVVRNPLAEPYILGVSAGAGVGAVAVIVWGSAAVAGLPISIAAFIGACAATAAVYCFALRNGRVLPQRLILSGVALGSLFSAITSYLTITTDAQNVFSVMFFLLGSVSAATMESLAIPAAALLIATLVVLPNLSSLNALLAGEESATSFGVNVSKLRQLMLVTSALLTGAVVAVCGGIGFVGLVVPHIARIVVGSDHRKMIPTALLSGAVFLATADLLARTIAQPTEIPIGIITALVGAPFFLWLMRRGSAAKAGF